MFHYYRRNDPIQLRTYCKGKRSHSRVSYYNYSTATFHLLLRSGDVEENPGPQNNKNLMALRCTECEKPVAKNHKQAICTECFDIMHAKCTRFLNLKAVSSTVPASWTCLKCTSNLLPFSLHNIPDLDEFEQYDTFIGSTTPNNTNIRSILDQHPKHLKIMHLNTQRWYRHLMSSYSWYPSTLLMFLP